MLFEFHSAPEGLVDIHNGISRNMVARILSSTTNTGSVPESVMSRELMDHDVSLDSITSLSLSDVNANNDVHVAKLPHMSMLHSPSSLASAFESDDFFDSQAASLMQELQDDEIAECATALGSTTCTTTSALPTLPMDISDSSDSSHTTHVFSAPPVVPNNTPPRRTSMRSKPKAPFGWMKEEKDAYVSEDHAAHETTDTFETDPTFALTSTTATKQHGTRHHAAKANTTASPARKKRVSTNSTSGNHRKRKNSRSNSISDSILPPDHKPARGRGRQKQLTRMSEAQKQQERILRAEKARLAAKDGRIRRKNATEKLELQVQLLVKKDTDSQKLIHSLRIRIQELEMEHHTKTPHNIPRTR
eukprot:m.86181 g.86181  ORF g.86181 m.86181 type:complete len:361 (+) comp25940_c0_seq1:788-1870(+)